MVKQCSDMGRKECGILKNNFQKVVSQGSARGHHGVSQRSARVHQGVSQGSPGGQPGFSQGVSQGSTRGHWYIFIRLYLD